MEFKTVIGLEIHVQLKTQSKMFCGCDNNAEGAEPNTLVCPVCLGLPGVLPVANRQAIEWTIKTGLALGSKIPEFSKFDRKHYFYPDLPKGYQISQYDLPFVVGGRVEIDVPRVISTNGNEEKSQEGKISRLTARNDNVKRNIHLTRIHLEEDAGKLIHDHGDSLVDLNRAGTPLMEIVTEPEISSPQEAKIFLQELRSIMRYLDVSSADMEKGHLRCDANISVSVDGKMGTPVEIKNMNSFRMVERALLFEEVRQRKELEEGRKIAKETRGWDDLRGETYSQRSKEQAQDYRYFPEPDLPPFMIHEAYDLEELKKTLPELPAQKRARYVSELNIPLQDAEVLSLDKQMADYFEQVAKKVTPKLTANWIINELKFDGLLILAPEKLIGLLTKIETNSLSGKMAKEILPLMIETGKTADEIIEEKQIKQIGGEEELLLIIEEVLTENENIVNEIKAGKTAAKGFLVGQVMKKTNGQANPGLVNKIIDEKVQ